MLSMTSFVDEMVKISASMCASKGPKARSGRRPIRVDKLLKKAQAPVVQAGEGVLTKALPFLRANYKTMGTMGLTGAGVLTARQGIEDLRRGRQYRKAMEGRQ